MKFESACITVTARLTAEYGIVDWLFLCFGGLSEQHAEQGGQEMFAPNTGIVHEFEKAQVQG